MKDIQKLLVGHMGEDWMSDTRFFLKNFVDGPNSTPDRDNYSDSDVKEDSQCLEEDNVANSV